MPRLTEGEFNQILRQGKVTVCDDSALRKSLQGHKEKAFTLAAIAGQKPALLVTPKAGIEIVPTTDESKLNKTENEWLGRLRMAGYEWVGIQCLTFKLADDTRYTPDFIVIRNGHLEAHEVKGFFRDDAKVKIKVAARSFRWLKFILVRKQKKEWTTEEVKP